MIGSGGDEVIVVRIVWHGEIMNSCHTWAKLWAGGVQLGYLQDEVLLDACGAHAHCSDGYAPGVAGSDDGQGG